MFYFLTFITCFSLFLQTTLLGNLSSGTVSQLSISNNNNNAQTVVNSAGNAVIVWSNPFTNQIFASIFNGATFVGPTQIVIGNPPKNGPAGTIAPVQTSQIGIDQSGNAIVVTVNPNTGQVQVSIYNALMATWFAPFLLGTGISPQIGTVQTGNNGNIPSPSTLIGQTGNVVVAWLSPDINRILATTFNLSTVTQTSGITTLATVNTTNNITALLVRANNLGNAAAIWTTFINQIQGATFNATTLTWTTPPVTIATNSGFPGLGVDQLGFGIVTWQNFANGFIFANRFPIP